MLTRRQFLHALGGMSIALATTRSFPQQPQLTSLAYNILGCRGYPRNKYTELALDAAAPTLHLQIADAIAETGADIVNLSECPEEPRVAAIAERLKFNYAFFPGAWPGDEEYPGGFPGAILSRYALRDATNSPVVGARDPESFTRHFGRATVQTGSGDLDVYSVHLMPNDAVEIRLREIDAVLVSVAARPHPQLGILVQGDLNHTPDSEEYKCWVAGGFTDCYASVGGADGATFSSARPRERIDYVWAKGELAKSIESCATLNEPPFSTDAKNRGSFASSDHLPVRATFSL